MKCFIFPIFVILVLSSCRDKRYSERLYSKDAPAEWRMQEFLIDDSLYRSDIIFDISKCNIVEEVCSGNVSSALLQEGESEFSWQFQNNGKIVSIQRSSDNDYNELMDDWIYSISGTYNVIKAKKKEMIFESDATVGYPGQKVKIVLERQE